jgi:hypothetical protein
MVKKRIGGPVANTRRAGPEVGELGVKVTGFNLMDSEEVIPPRTSTAMDSAKYRDIISAI